ncbi:hypothetical protein [Tritonibacter mobilis]|uniref:hypothetical protein n=1 Tax=Tritonibacter mobilis TaxID=379347 RepID=UPI0013A65CE1|nr:hypothetical protein [Tritonibacter mobilis]
MKSHIEWRRPFAVYYFVFKRIYRFERGATCDRAATAKKVHLKVLFTLAAFGILKVVNRLVAPS